MRLRKCVGLLGASLEFRPLLLDQFALMDIQPANPDEWYVPNYNPAYVWGPPVYGGYPPLPYPGVATDYSPLLVAMLSGADGVGILTENLFSGRFRYVEELRRMGADIRTEGHHAVVRGVGHLSGAPVRAPDLRAGVALVLAGLVAEGETVVTGAHHIDRGYADLVGSLRSLGAKVTSQ